MALWFCLTFHCSFGILCAEYIDFLGHHSRSIDVRFGGSEVSSQGLSFDAV